MQYPPPTASAPTNATPTGQGHGPFSGEDIQQIMADSGYSYSQVCADIDRTGAQSKETLYPQLYSGEGIQPQGETVGPGVVQGAAPPPDARAQAQAAMQGNAAPPMMPPAEASEGEAPQTPQAEAMEGESEGIPPEVAQAMHTAMAPPTRKRMRR